MGIIHRAIDLGVTLIDTSDAYCVDDTEVHHNERLIRKALESYRGAADVGQVVVATKGGIVRPGGRWELDTSPGHIASAIAGSHEALSGRARPIQLWQVHSLRAPRNSVEEMLGPVADAIAGGIVARVGLSNCSVAQIAEAQRVLPAGALVSVQNEYSIWERAPERDGVLEYCEAQGLAFLPYGALGGRRARSGERSLRNTELFPNVARVAERHRMSAERVCLAWMLAKWPCIVHITGARSLAHLEDSLGAADVVLGAEEVAAIDSDGPDAAAPRCPDGPAGR